MRKDKDRELLWVSSDFKRALKVEAANSGKSVLELTRELSRMVTPASKMAEDARRKKKYDFF